MKKHSFSMFLFLLVLVFWGFSCASCGEDWVCQKDADCVSSDWKCSDGLCVQITTDGGLQRDSIKGDETQSEKKIFSEKVLPKCMTGQRRTCYTGSANTAGHGLCKVGSQLCVYGKWDVCVGQVLPKKEICDKQDNDCDGLVDEGGVCVKPPVCKPSQVSGCYTGPKSTMNKGNCKIGKRTCNAQGQWSSLCVGQVLPKKEICDKQDNDCDGLVDEGGVCGKPPVCKPGQKSDCYTGPKSTMNKGNCKIGKRTCSSTGQWLPCVGQVLPQKEICDKRDNDCDGLVDEGGVCGACTVGQKLLCYTLPAGKPGLGSCRAGIKTCTSQGKWGACIGQIGPVVEVCNNKDDDCDGLTDESDPMMNKPCKTGKPGICSDGYYGCAKGIRVCVSIYQPHIEICNNKDDDCNGKIDDGTKKNTYYRDADKDGYGNPAKPTKACTRPNGYVRDNTDCYDANRNVHPNQTAFFTVHRGDGKFDYDCNGKEDRRFSAVGSCKGCKTPIFDQGFSISIPKCGTKGNWITACRFDVGKCYPLTSPKVQECR